TSAGKRRRPSMPRPKACAAWWATCATPPASRRRLTKSSAAESARAMQDQGRRQAAPLVHYALGPRHHTDVGRRRDDRDRSANASAEEDARARHVVAGRHHDDPPPPALGGQPADDLGLSPGRVRLRAGAENLEALLPIAQPFGRCPPGIWAVWDDRDACHP